MQLSKKGGSTVQVPRKIGALALILAVWSVFSVMAGDRVVSPRDPGVDPPPGFRPVFGPVFVAAPTCSVRICKLKPGRYWFSVRAVDSSGLYSEAARCTIEISGNAAGIPRETRAPRLLIFPNPAASRIFVRANFPGLLSLFDARGGHVTDAPFKAGTVVVSLSTLPSGVYFYRTSPEGLKGKLVLVR